ncbi:MAG: helix-turn-helix domain-containing protein [Patescibacteria group bacterium]
MKNTTGQYIQNARKELGYTQFDLADKVSVSRMTISRYEIGSTEIPLKQLRKISKALKKPITYFFTGEDKLHSQKVWNKARDSFRLLKDTMQISPEDMLAFSLEDKSKKDKAIKEAKKYMKKWYKENNMEKELGKIFEVWWEGK